MWFGKNIKFSGTLYTPGLQGTIFVPTNEFTAVTLFQNFILCHEPILNLPIYLKKLPENRNKLKVCRRFLNNKFTKTKGILIFY